MTLNEKEKTILRKALEEFNGSLTRQDAERELQKDICQRIKTEIGLKPSQTRKLAKMYFKQNKSEIEAEMDEILTAYEEVISSS